MDFSGYPKSLFAFHRRIYRLVNDPSTDSLISWSESNKSFIIRNEDELTRSKILSRFYCKTVAEFIARLKDNGFEEIKGSAGHLEFGNKKFVRGKPELLAEMQYTTVMDRCFRKPSKAMKAEADVKDGLRNLRI